MKNKKAFTLIEIICATAITLLLTISTIQIISWSMKMYKDRSLEIQASQILDNFFDYIDYELNINTIEIIKDENKNTILKYNRDLNYSTTLGKRSQMYIEKTIKYDKNSKKLYLFTKTVKRYKEDLNTKEGKNILLENVQEAKSTYENNDLKLKIKILYRGVEKEKEAKISLNEMKLSNI